MVYVQIWQYSHLPGWDTITMGQEQCGSNFDARNHHLDKIRLRDPDSPLDYVKSLNIPCKSARKRGGGQILTTAKYFKDNPYFLPSHEGAPLIAT